MYMHVIICKMLSLRVYILLMYNTEFTSYTAYIQ